MAVIQKTLFAKNLDKYSVLVNDTDPNSKYFKITELPDTFTGGKNAFLIAGSDLLVADTKILIEIKSSDGKIIYNEPGEGYISSSFNGVPFVTEYYEGVSKVVSVYVYPDTSFGECTITILGEVNQYEDGNGMLTPIPLDWEGKYNVKWQKTINVNPSLANTTKIRFYERPTANITEILAPIYRIVSGSKVDSGINQSFANIKLSKLETFAGDVKRVKVFRTSEGDISDYSLIQDILVEAKELLTSYNLSGSVIGNTGIFTSETLTNFWNTGSLNVYLTSSRIESGIALNGSGLFTYTSSLDIKSTNTYELNLDAFYSSSISSNLGIYLVSGLTGSSIATLNGTAPTKNLSNIVIPFKIDTDYPSASLYFSQSQGEWHLGNISLKLSQDTAFSPDEISFVTTMPTVIGNETYNFKFEFYDVNNNYVPVAVTQSAIFNGGNTNIGETILLISSSTSQSLADLNRVSSSISGTMTVYSSSASSSVGIVSGSVFNLSGSVSTSVQLLTGSISSSLSSSFGYASSSVYTLSGSVSSSQSALSASISTSVYNSLTQSFTYVQSLANGNYSGSFISGNIIYAPVIGGQLGYFSTLFKVGQSPNSIYLDARQTPRKIFIGGAIPSGDTEYSGAYNNTNTNVYLDSSGKFSLADKLTFDGAGNLSVNGSITVTGGNAATDVNALLYSQRAVVSGSNAAGNAVVSGSNAAGNAVVSSSLYSANAAASASISASAAQIFATNQAISASNNTYNQSTALLQTLANGAYSGSFIGNTTIYSPNIGGQNGYISNILKVGQNGITLDGVNKAIYVGTGTYNSTNTPFYFASGSTNIFSLGTGLTWNGSTLNINGGGTFSGNLSAAGGTFSGNLSAAGGDFTGTLVAAGGSFAGDVTAASGRIGGWYIDSSSIYVPNAISLNSTAKSITISDTSAVPRVLINQNTSFSSLSAGSPTTVSGLSSNNTAGGYTAGTYDRTLGTVTTVSGGTYNVTGTWTETNGVSAVVMSGTAFTIDVWSQIVVDNGITETIIGEYKDGVTFGSTANWAAINGVAKSLTMTGNGNTWTIKQRFKLQYNGSGLTGNSYRQPALSVTIAKANSFVEIIAGGIQVGRDSANYVIMDRAGVTAMLQVGGDGTFTGDVTANTSDKRLKNNIRIIDNPLEKLSKINGVYFNWNETAKELANKNDNEEVGFLAQEVQSVLPQIIKPAPFDMDTKTGESKSGENYLTIQYEKIVPLLVEAIKELKKQVDELKNK